MGEAYYQIATGGPSVVPASALVLRVVDREPGAVLVQVRLMPHEVERVRAITEQYHPRYEATLTTASAALESGWDGWWWRLCDPHGLPALHRVLNNSAEMYLAELDQLSADDLAKLRQAVDHRWYHGLTDADIAAMQAPQGVPASLADRMARFVREGVGDLRRIENVLRQEAR